MKYHKDKEDKHILEGKSDKQIADLVGCDPSYIYLLRKGRRTASWDFYKKLKTALDKQSNIV